jgi:glycosyltransferase involved in cell wall biosynthesis
MKLAYLSSAAIPSTSANSLQVMKMCQALDAEGALVTLFAPASPIEPARADLERSYGISMPFALRRIHSLPILGRRGLASAAVRAARLTGCEATFTRGVDFAWWSALSGMPTILELHQPPSGFLGRLYFQDFLRAARGRIVLISEQLRVNMMRAYPRLHRMPVLVAPDAVDLERYTGLPEAHNARTQIGLPPDRFTVGYFGSLVPGRGLDLITALAARFPHIVFLVCGGTPDQVRAQSERNPLSNLRWTGHIPHADVPLHQAACEVLLMPYERKVTVQGKGDTSETMSPMKLYEYMASGRLILASDLPALRVILNEQNCMLLPPIDVDPWASALQAAESDSARRTMLGAQAKRDVAPFTWRNRARAILKFAFPD